MKNCPKTIINLLFISLLLISCARHKQSAGVSVKAIQNENIEQIPVFDLKNPPATTKVKLSEIGAVDIEYIPLETKQQSMISNTEDLFSGYKLVVGDKNFITHRFTSILEFSNDGLFIAKVGTKGRGPGEFTAAHDVNFNNTNKEIYLLARWQKKFFVYSMNGKLLRTFPISFSPSEFCFVGDRILCYSENHMGDIQNSYTLIDTSGKVIKTFPNKYPFINHDAYGIRAENIFYKFDNELYKKEVYSDTIFKYDNENFLPHIVIEVGDKLISPKARGEFDGLYLAKNYIIPLNLFEFGDFVYYNFSYKYDIYNEVLIYSFIGSKKNNSKRLFNSVQGIINDLDGGPNFLPRAVKDDNTVIGWIDALKLKTYIASESFKNSTPKYSEKKQEVERLANSLKETDNPVLVICRLK
jgi:hypothetical protein